MLGTTLVHEFHISYGHTEWYLLSSLRENVHNKICQQSTELYLLSSLRENVHNKIGQQSTELYLLSSLRENAQ